MGVMFGFLGVGFLTILSGLIASSGKNGVVEGGAEVLVFLGMLLMAIGVVGSAAVSARRRSRERAEEAKERRELARR